MVHTTARRSLLLTVCLLLGLTALGTTQNGTRRQQESRGVAVVPTIPPVSPDERRVALLIGNDRYQHVTQLERAASDAQAVGVALRQFGFEVLTHMNLDRRGMNQAGKRLNPVQAAGVGGACACRGGSACARSSCDHRACVPTSVWAECGKRAARSFGWAAGPHGPPAKLARRMPQDQTEDRGFGRAFGPGLGLALAGRTRVSPARLVSARAGALAMPGPVCRVCKHAAGGPSAYFTPGDIYEAAKVDGATTWQRFTRITLPLLTPALLVALIFRTMDALRAFDLPKVLTNGANGTTTLSLLSSRTFQENRLYGEGSALAILTFIIVMAVAFLYIRFVGGNLRGLTED
jgi:hypothetical protein